MRVKKFLALLCIAVVVICMLPLSVLAANGKTAYAVLRDDGVALFYYDDKINERKSKTYLCKTMWETDSAWHKVKSKITTVSFNETFADYRPTNTSNWFSNCTNLKKINGLKNLNTSHVTFMYNMFENCSSLTGIDLSTFNVSNVTSMAYMFVGCTKLESPIYVNKWNTSNVRTISHMFDGCSALTKLDLKNWDVSNVDDMSFAFDGCSALASLSVGTWSTGKVTDMNHIFSGCRALTSLNLSSWNTGNVTDINCAFSGCSALTSLNLSSWNTGNVTDMDQIFRGCSALTSLNVSSWNTGNVTDMSWAFYGCSALTSINVSSWNTAKARDMCEMFAFCSNLVTLDLSSFNTSNVKDSSFMFAEDSKLETIYVGSKWNVSGAADTDYMFYDCDKLVGEKNTAYADDHRGGDYAIVDGTNGKPGYLSDLSRKITLITCKDDIHNAEKIDSITITATTYQGFITEANSKLAQLHYTGCKIVGWTDGTNTYGLDLKFIFDKFDKTFYAVFEKLGSNNSGTTGGTTGGTGTGENPGGTNGGTTGGTNGGSTGGENPGSSNNGTNGGTNSGTSSGTNNGSGSNAGSNAGSSATPASTPIPTPKPQPTLAPAELSVGDFINRCYEVALGREADEAGYNYWWDALNNGQACGAQVGYGFIFSQEYTNKNTDNKVFVTDLYSMYFGRKPDEEGFNYWVDLLDNGASREAVFAGFANSQEFYNLCTKYGVTQGYYVQGMDLTQQGGVNCFVARMYTICLNRLPDMGGQAGWVLKLINGEVTGSVCSYGFIMSPEFISLDLNDVDFVAYMYRAFFGREGAEEELNGWVNNLAGGLTREDVFNGFSGSVEFAALCASYGINA